MHDSGTSHGVASDRDMDVAAGIMRQPLDDYHRMLIDQARRDTARAIERCRQLGLQLLCDSDGNLRTHRNDHQPVR